MDKTKILIADDHRVVVAGVRTALNDHPDFEVVGEAFDGRQAVELAKSLKPDIAILDVSMPQLSGIDAAKEIRGFSPDIRIVIFTMHTEKQYVIDLFRAGISAYVLKQDPISDLVLALKSVRGGGTYFSTFAPTILLRHMEDLEECGNAKDGFDDLSLREREVFLLLANGRPIKKIAEELFISPKTVESHKYNIMYKLKCKTMTGLTKIGIRRNLIEP